MKKKRIIFIIVLLVIAAAICYLCYPKKVNYDWNFGFDLEKLKYKEVCFNIYHTNTEDHYWEKIASFSCENGEGPYYNINVEAEEADDLITIELENRTRRESEGSVYKCTTVDSFTFEVEGFEGNLLTIQHFEIVNKKGEQLYQLYPISNGYGALAGKVSLDEPYNPGNVNLDNILITIEMK